MSKKTTFGIDKYQILHCRHYFTEEQNLTGAIVGGHVQIQTGHILPMGTPCITTNDFNQKPHDPDSEMFSLASKAVVIVPSRSGIPPWTRVEVFSNNLKANPRIKSPIETMRVIEESLDIDRVGRLREYLHGEECVSFILEESDKRAKRTVLFIQNLFKTFKYGFETWVNIPNIDNEVVSSNEKDELISVVSFFNVMSVAPIVDTRRVDGVFITVEHVLKSMIERTGTIEKAIDTMILLFTNYTENFIHVDGGHLSDYRPFDDRSLDKLNRTLRRKSMSKVKHGLPPKAKSGEKKIPTLEPKESMTVGTGQEPGIQVKLTTHGELADISDNSAATFWKISSSTTSTEF